MSIAAEPTRSTQSRPSHEDFDVMPLKPFLVASLDAAITSHNQQDYSAKLCPSKSCNATPSVDSSLHANTFFQVFMRLSNIVDATLVKQATHITLVCFNAVHEMIIGSVWTCRSSWECTLLSKVQDVWWTSKEAYAFWGQSLDQMYRLQEVFLAC